MHVKCYDTLSQVSPSDWNSIVGRTGVICRHEFLHAVELSRINDCRYFYPVVYEGNQIVAHACLYFISTKLDTLVQGCLKRGIELVRKVATSFLVMKSVECGTPVALGSTISLREGAVSTSALCAIVDKAQEIADDMKVKMLLFRDFEPDKTVIPSALCGMGFKTVHNLPSAHLGIRWKSFADYENAMKSEYRYKIRSRRKEFLTAGGALTMARRFDNLVPLLARLWRNVHDRATEYKREVLSDAFFANMANVGEQIQVLLATVNSEPAGFLLLMFDEDKLTPLFCGLDYRITRSCPVYFNLFYGAIEVAIDRGLKLVDFGITNLGPKAELGAKAVQLRMYMRCQPPLMQTLVPRLFDAITPFDSVPERHVFVS